MQRVKEIPATKLKFFSLLLSGISIGIFVWFCIVYTTGYFQYVLWPVISILFCLAPDDKKVKLVTNKIAEIIMYVIYGAWALAGAIQLIQLLTNGFGTLIEVVGFFKVLPLLGLFISAVLAAGASGLYFYSYKKGVDANNGEAPLLSSEV